MATFRFSLRVPLLLVALLSMVTLLWLSSASPEPTITSAPRDIALALLSLSPQFESDGTAESTTVTAASGGTLRTADGRLSVTFPAGALRDDATISFTPLKKWAWGASGMRMVNLFD